MLTKLHKQHANHPHYIKPKSAQNTQFGIKHFAGTVFYQSIGKEIDFSPCVLISIDESIKLNAVLVDIW